MIAIRLALARRMTAANRTMTSDRGVILSPLLPWVVHRPAALATAARFSSGSTRTPGETINRINQDARPRATAATSKPVKGALGLWKPTGSFATALQTNQAIKRNGQQGVHTPRGIGLPGTIDPPARTTTQTRWSCRRSGTAVPSRSGTHTAEVQAACACRNRAGPAPTFSPTPRAPPDRPPRPRTNSESANPVVDDHGVAGSWLALRWHGRFRADRARMKGTLERKSQATRSSEIPASSI